MNNSHRVFGGFENRIFVKPVNMDFVCAICSRNFLKLFSCG